MRKVLSSALLTSNESLLKLQNKPLRETAVLLFKQKAVGQDIQGFESLLREGISKKYKEIKAEFARACRQQALEFLEPEIQIIKRNIQNNIYEDFEKVREAIEGVRARFMEGQPEFQGRVEMFQEMQIQLVQRAADLMTSAQRKEQDQSVKRLQEKINEIEAQRYT